jgi:hypothetical protein
MSEILRSFFQSVFPNSYSIYEICNFPILQFEQSEPSSTGCFLPKLHSVAQGTFSVTKRREDYL